MGICYHSPRKPIHIPLSIVVILSGQIHIFNCPGTVCINLSNIITDNNLSQYHRAEKRAGALPKCDKNWLRTF